MHPANFQLLDSSLATEYNQNSRTNLSARSTSSEHYLLGASPMSQLFLNHPASNFAPKHQYSTSQIKFSHMSQTTGHISQLQAFNTTNFHICPNVPRHPFPIPIEPLSTRPIQMSQCPRCLRQAHDSNQRNSHNIFSHMSQCPRPFKQPGRYTISIKAPTKISHKCPNVPAVPDKQLLSP